jgi:hypothetical protein
MLGSPSMLWRQRRPGVHLSVCPLISYDFQHAGAVSPALTPVLYAVAMAVSGTGSLILGRLFDRAGIGVLIPLSVVAAMYAPLVFLGRF